MAALDSYLSCVLSSQTILVDFYPFFLFGSRKQAVVSSFIAPNYGVVKTCFCTAAFRAAYAARWGRLNIRFRNDFPLGAMSPRQTIPVNIELRRPPHFTQIAPFALTRPALTRHIGIENALRIGPKNSYFSFQLQPKALFAAVV
jgi:hypothetical protein